MARAGLYGRRLTGKPPASATSGKVVPPRIADAEFFGECAKLTDKAHELGREQEQIETQRVYALAVEKFGVRAVERHLDAMSAVDRIGIETRGHRFQVVRNGDVRVAQHGVPILGHCGEEVGHRGPRRRLDPA